MAAPWGCQKPFTPGPVHWGAKRPVYALAAAIIFLGLVAGWWIVAIGAFLVVPALVGWTFEYWKGPHHL